MDKTRPSVTCYRDGDDLVAWGEPKDMEPRQFWFPLSDDAQEQAREESVAGREVVIDDGVIVAFR